MFSHYELQLGLKQVKSLSIHQFKTLEYPKYANLKTLSSLLSLYFGAKLFKWLIKYLHKVWVINKVPGPRMTPFIGNTAYFRSKFSPVINGLLAVTNPFPNRSFSRFWLATQPWIIFYKADKLDVLLESSELITKSFDYTFLQPWLGLGLLTSDGELWKSRRKLITPTFHFDILKSFFNVMNEQCDTFIDNLARESSKNCVFDLMPFLSTCTLDIICETAMGETVQAQKNTDSEYVKALDEITRIVMKRSRLFWLWSDFIFNLTETGRAHAKCLRILHGFTERVIKERLRTFENANLANEKRIAFLDLLLKVHHENPNKLTLKNIREEVDTFMFEGHDTTSVTLQWCLFAISKRPEIQKKLQEEVDSIIMAGHQHIEYEKLGDLKYLDCVIKESMRIFTTVAFVAREITKDIVIDGYKIPKGTTAAIFLYKILRDEKYFPDCETFIPERFLPENADNRHPFAYIPFSAGKRNCIGQRFAMIELKVILSRLIRNFEFNCDQTFEELNFEHEVVTRPTIKILFKLTKRE